MLPVILYCLKMFKTWLNVEHFAGYVGITNSLFKTRLHV